MFKKFLRLIRPNPLNVILCDAKKKRQKKFLLAWNRGMGDVSLLLYGLVHRISEKIEHPEITFLVRKDLEDAFSLLKNIHVICAPDWVRHKPYDVYATLHKLGIDPKNYDVILTWPDPEHWLKNQQGKLVPRLTWNPDWDPLYKKFFTSNTSTYIGVQVEIETGYALWRNWSLKEWHSFFSHLEYQRDLQCILLGQTSCEKFSYANLIDLREKTTLYELFSIIKNVCASVILPDSGILSTIYYLDTFFPLHLFSQWTKTGYGILKQNVPSPNPLLTHTIIKNMSKRTGKELAHLVLKHFENGKICKKSF